MKSYEQIQGIYIHIPFCLQKCFYCDFVSFEGQNKSTMDKYTQALCREIEKRAGEMPCSETATVYFGGGTPTTLSLENLKEIVDTLKKVNLWQKPKEVTIEANPGTVNLDKLQVLRQLGFNRISFGVQSLRDEELKLMGRVHSAKEALTSINEAKTVGFKRISGDLIVGYPGQTLESVKTSLEGMAKSGVTHMSVYGLSVEKGTMLSNKIKNKELGLPEEEITASMYEWTNIYLPQEGFKRYEISNYAQKGEESQHNLVYWKYLPYFGFGLNACSFLGDHRVNNPRTFEEYFREEKAEIETLTVDNLAGEAMFMGLRKKEGVDLKEIKERFGKDIMKECGKDIAQKVDLGLILLDEKNQRMCLTDKGMQFANQVFTIFL